MIHKITFDEGIVLDGKKIKGVTGYKIDGDNLGDYSELTLKLFVDDSALFEPQEQEGNTESYNN